MDCGECDDKKCIKTLKCCEKIEKKLPKIPISMFGLKKGEHYELPFNTDYLEKIAVDRAFLLKGIKNQPTTYQPEY